MADMKPNAQETLRVTTQADAALEAQQKLNKDKLDKDDARRARDGKVAMVCVSPFVLVDNPAEPDGRVVQAGEELSVSAGDVQAYTGRLRLKADPGAPDLVNGPQVSRG